MRGVSLSVDAGQIVTVIGPNGAGKTTLLAPLMGCCRSRGTMRFDGGDLARLDVEDAGRARVLPGAGTARTVRRHDGGGQPGAGRLCHARRDGTMSRQRSIEVYARFPRLRRAARPARRHAVGRRAPDAGARPRADGRPRLLLLDEPSLGLAPLMVRRRSSASSRRCASPACRFRWSSRTRAPRWRWPITATCSKWARSRIKARAGALAHDPRVVAIDPGGSARWPRRHRTTTLCWRRR